MMRNKYGAKKITASDGSVFDSKREFHRWCELRLLEKAGKISGLCRQVSFELIPKQEGERAVYYVADFTYYEDGNFVVEDCKGYKTDVYKLKKKLLLYRWGYKIKET